MYSLNCVTKSGVVTANSAERSPTRRLQSVLPMPYVAKTRIAMKTLLLRIATQRSLPRTA